MTTTTLEIKGLEAPNPSDVPHIRLGIQGVPGSGKSVAAVTFPNPIYLEMENILDGLADTIQSIHGIDIKTQVKRIPVYKESWVEMMLGPAQSKLCGTINRRDAILKWVKEEAKKIPQGHTLIVDTWTTLQTHFDITTSVDPKHLYTKKGDEDTYKFWAYKGEYAEEISAELMNLQCNVVVLYHEAQERDKVSGLLLQKTQPVMQGKFVTYLKKFFPNYFRALCQEIKGSDGKTIIENGKKKVQYVWQTSSDNEFDAKCAIVGLPMYVPAHYNSLVKKV